MGTPGSCSVHRGHSSSLEHLPVSTWTQGHGRLEAAACWEPGVGLAGHLSYCGLLVTLAKLHCLLCGLGGLVEDSKKWV